MNNAAIIGYGAVGKATAHAFSIKKRFDINPRRSNITLKDASECKFIFICMPTNEVNGRYKTDDIFNLVKQVTDYGQSNIFIIRSTVYVGFADSLRNNLGINSVVSNPEFFTEKTWKDDVENPDIVVIGSEHKPYRDAVEGIYKSRYRGVDIFTTDSRTAELSKLAINSFYTTKVVFANQIFDFAQKTNSNYETIKDIMYSRKWIGKNHLDIFHNNGRGAGGKCLKKDTTVLAEMSQLPLIKTVVGINNSYLMGSGKE